MLRRAQIARRRRVLDLACASGAVTRELVDRCGGKVVAVDRDLRAMSARREPFAGAARVCADAARLPLADGSCDLVFCQMALMWLDAPAVLAEIRRVLRSGGLLAAVEPDYGGMIEYPPEIATRDLWVAALARAGADPQVGRKLPGLVAAAGLKVRVDLLERLECPSPVRFDLLGGLPLSDAEKDLLGRIQRADAACADCDRVVHLPMFLITAEKR